MSTAVAPLTSEPRSAALTAPARIPTLDGWRGIAILLVLIGHFSITINRSAPLWIRQLGQHGVAIFFVLSGYLITTLLLQEKSRTGYIDLRRFYLRRFFRLMPCAWLYLALLFLFTSTTHQDLGIVSSLFFFRNYSPSSHFITGHFWSLAIEEQFYLVWPGVLLLLGLKRALRFAVVAALSVAAWRFFHWPESFAPTTETQFRADALLVGCIMAIGMPRLKRYLRDWMALPLLAYVLICIVHYPSLIPLHESVAIALLLAITTQSASLLFRPLDAKPLAFLGCMSYSIYVWQQPVWVIAAQVPHPVVFSLILLPTLSLASYYLIEKQGIRLGQKLNSCRQPRAINVMYSTFPAGGVLRSAGDVMDV